MIFALLLYFVLLCSIVASWRTALFLRQIEGNPETKGGGDMGGVEEGETLVGM